jgi:hypothetical protein
VSLWEAPNKWISDPEGFVFLPRAIDRVGKAAFSNEWTGAEPTTPIIPSLPPVSAFASRQVRLEVHDLLRAECPQFQRGPLKPPFDPSFTNTEWEAAQELCQRKYLETQPALLRFNKVCETVASGCRSGALVSAWRPRDGGGMTPIPTVWWNTEGEVLRSRFIHFSLDPKHPFQAGLTEQRAWICVSSASLDAFIGRLSGNSASIAKDEADAIRHLARRLREEPDLKRSDAEAECAQFKLSQRGFRARIWPKARQEARLSPIGRAGRKKSRR